MGFIRIYWDLLGFIGVTLWLFNSLPWYRWLISRSFTLLFTGDFQKSYVKNNQRVNNGNTRNFLG